MKDFSVTQVAFSGYRLLARQPLTAVWWFGFSLLVSIITIGLTVELAGEPLAAMANLQRSATPDPATAMALMGRLVPFYVVVSFLWPWLIGVVTIGAGTRAVIRPESAGFGYLRFGGDELRLLMTTLVIGVITILVFLVFYMIAAIVLVSVVGVGGLQALRNGGGLAAIGPGLVAGGVVVLLGLALLVYLFVKFAMAPAQTVAARSIRIFDSWALSKGHFWGMLGALVLGMIPAIVLAVIVGLVGLALAGGFSGNLLQASQSRLVDMTTLSGAFQGKYLVNLVLEALLRTALIAGAAAPAAALYQALAPADDEDVFD